LGIYNLILTYGSIAVNLLINGVILSTNTHQNIKIIVAMSGGVDSSIAAHLLIQQGYQVEGMFMKNWEEQDTDTTCSAEQDAKDAEAVCQKLNIKFHKVNFASEYWDNVFENFLSEYQHGRTPNPDILCNREIKFKVFLQYAQHLGADFIATGHYAGVEAIEHLGTTEYFLTKSFDTSKDQTYFLYTLGQKQLAKVMFPLANYKKSQVRSMAEKLGLITHNKKDSTGICFIGEVKFKNFLSNYLPNQPGPIVAIGPNDTKRIVGQHDGLMYYTLGQRKGLHIGGLRDANEEPWYVVDKNLATNELYIVQGDNPLLYNSELAAEQLSFVNEQIFNDPIMTSFKCYAKVRYRQTEQACTVTIDQQLKTCKVIFDFKQRAITPGQSIVFYEDNRCLGGGIIIARK
jgi:tRNA-specific 2-thiouridylase